MSRLEQIADLEKRFLLSTYNRYPVAFERGKGVFLYDFEGKKYLDFVAGLGVNALGHAHPRVVSDARAGGSGHSPFESLLQRISRTASRASVPAFGARPRLLFEQRHGGDGRRPKAGASRG